jgi:hypothetical protein
MPAEIKQPQVAMGAAKAYFFRGIPAYALGSCVSPNE